MLNKFILLRQLQTYQVLLSRKFHRTYYDTLKLTPSATTQDIKKAYYQLSLEYHPDKPYGNEDKFREITAAYEVLGNIRLRRLYDNGLLSGQPSIARTTKDGSAPGFRTPEPFESHFRRGQSRSDDPIANAGRVYDHWTATHYTVTLKRDRIRKQEYLKHERKRVQLHGDGRARVFVVLLTIGLLIVASLVENPYDRPPKKS